MNEYIQLALAYCFVIPFFIWSLMDKQEEKEHRYIMKHKNQKMQSLKEDLIKYSKQIGILDNEIPKLAF